MQAQFFSGWNNFIADNDLKSGDSLIFDLIVEASYFQVYIFRSSWRHKIASIIFNIFVSHFFQLT